MLELFATKTGKIIISIIWGLGLAFMFHQSCKGNNCIIIQAPKKEEVEDKIFYYGENNCYKYNTKITSCKNADKK